MSETIFATCGGLNIRDWRNVGDHCAALETFLLQGVAGENGVGGDYEQTNLAMGDILFDLMESHLGRPNGTDHNQRTYVHDRAAGYPRNTIDGTKIHTQLRWHQPEGFKDNLGKRVT